MSTASAHSTVLVVDDQRGARGNSSRPREPRRVRCRRRSSERHRGRRGRRRARAARVVLDISMPGGSGLHAVRELLERVHGRARADAHRARRPRVRAGERAGRGARVLRKDSTPGELRAAIHAVHAGDDVLLAAGGPAARRGAPQRAHQPPARPSRRGPSTCSPRASARSCGTIAEGRTNKEIGIALGISTRTVEAHRDSLMKKLGIRTVAGLTRYALEQGIKDSRRIPYVEVAIATASRRGNLSGPDCGPVRESSTPRTHASIPIRFSAAPSRPPRSRQPLPAPRLVAPAATHRTAAGRSSAQSPSPPPARRPTCTTCRRR